MSDFANRLRKMVRHVGKWARRQGITCYRVYDRDVPGYPLAIDVYEGRVHAQVFARRAPRSAEEEAAWRDEVRAAIADALEVAGSAIVFKTRERQSDFGQYQQVGSDGPTFEVGEAGHRFWVNLTDHLDTGLFLDHRPLRARVGAEARGKRFLNLFAYTGAFTVYAACGGARTTTTVDLSNTYLDWAEQNLALNGVALGADHELVRADVIAWLEDAAATSAAYDLIVCDPPTFSRSKRMAATFDVLRDHPDLLRRCTALLRPGGVLYFSTNHRRFKFDEGGLPAGVAAREITGQTVPKDFERRAPHRAWRIEVQAPGRSDPPAA